jgi:hypothetical protein
MIEGLIIPIPQRLLFIRVTVCISLIASVLLSLNLWGGERVFPYAALNENAFVRAPFDFFIVGAFILFIIASLFLKKHRLLIFIALLIATTLVIIDVNRLQPWFYIYCAFLFALMFYNGRIDDANKFTSFFITLQFIFCSAYVFNGISQLNSLFVETDFSEVISPLQNMMSDRQFLFVKKIGVFVPYILIFIGIGLLIAPLRYLAITFAIIFHVLLIIFLFPSKTNQNYAMWFMNVSFIPLLFLLFSGKTKQRYYSPTLLLQFPLFYLIFTLFWIMPSFNQKGMWPDNLSGNFKSGNRDGVDISFTKTIYEKLPDYVKHFCYQKDSLFFIDYNRWCLHELKTDCYNDEPTFNNIYNYIKSETRANVNDLQMNTRAEQNMLVKP